MAFLLKRICKFKIDVYNLTKMTTKYEFKFNLSNAFTFMRENPDELEKNPIDMIKKLSDYMKSSGQSSANHVTNHEASISVIFEKYGFELSTQDEKKDGYYYVYQMGGSQKKGDFFLFWVNNGKFQSSIVADAKHSNKNVFYLNDGWFEEETIYIISFSENISRGVWKKMCFVGLGKDIPTEEDSVVMKEIIEMKKKLNSEKRSRLTSHLKVVFRFANQYSCKQFNHEFTRIQFEKMLAWLEP